MLFLDAAKNEYLTYLKLAEEKSLKKGAIIVADNVEVSKNEMLDYLKYVRLSGLYKSETIGTKLEFTPNVRDAIEVSITVHDEIAGMLDNKTFALLLVIFRLNRDLVPIGDML